jgi:hypothetical protein
VAIGSLTGTTIGGSMEGDIMGGGRGVTAIVAEACCCDEGGI